MTAIDSEQDLVVLLDDDGTPAGTAPRLAVHGTDTPLHQAFSLHLFDEEGRVLITRRALDKLTWPGVWTNSCCGHPRPGEDLPTAVRRRLREELGVDVEDLQLVLPDFRYRAVDASGVVENEICPVWVGRVSGTLAPDPHEVAEHLWVPWADLVASAGATPGVFSPWAVLQLPRLDAEQARLPLSPATSVVPPRDTTVPVEPVTGPAATLDAVADLLAEELGWVGAMWENLAPAGDAGPLTDGPGDLPGWLHDLLRAGGKRLRPQMCHWGFVAGGGRLGTPEHDDAVRAAAALETLHLFALVHDDVMDQSTERRGAAAAHVVAAEGHRASGGHGDPVRFGENIAILLGDLAHSEADRLVHTLPPLLRDFWFELNLELILGQRADLTGAASRRTDLEHVEAVAALKSGAYTVSRPLQLGALAAGADVEQRDALERYGTHLGRAFAWRDDVLGAWGDPGLTGKPAGDDLREGKATLIWVLGAERLRADPRRADAVEALDRVGTPDARDGDVALLQRALEEVGVRDDVEQRIRVETDAALAALDGSTLTAAGVAGLRDLARTISWRNA